MYIGTDLNRKYSSDTKCIDKLNFSLSISENSIPILDKYGLDIDESTSNIESILKNKLQILIDKLEGVSYENFNIDTNNKMINLTVSCGGKTISKTMSM